MTSRRSLPDLIALAQALAAWTLALAAWLAEELADGSLGPALRRWTRRALARAEDFATAIAVLAALKLLPMPPPVRSRAGRRPASAPRGFANCRRCKNDMRAMRRRLFPRDARLLPRARRLAAFLYRVMEEARALAPHLERCPPLFSLVAVAPPTTHVFRKSIGPDFKNSS